MAGFFAIIAVSMFCGDLSDHRRTSLAVMRRWGLGTINKANDL